MPATPPSKTRKIGNDDVTAIGYGAMGIAAFYGTIQPDEERLEVGAGSSMRCIEELMSVFADVGCTICQGLHQLGYFERLRRF